MFHWTEHNARLEFGSVNEYSPFWDSAAQFLQDECRYVFGYRIERKGKLYGSIENPVRWHIENAGVERWQFEILA